MGRLAQLDRACDLHSQGQGFKSSTAHQINSYIQWRARGVVWFNTSDCRSEDREFKSRRARQSLYPFFLIFILWKVRYILLG